MLELPQTKLLVKKTSTLRIEEGSEESLQTVSTVQSECEDAVEDVLLKMNKFKNERENKKNEKFKIVWLFGITLLVVGLIIYEVLNYMLSATTHKTSQILYSAFDCFASTGNFNDWNGYMLYCRSIQSWLIVIVVDLQ